MSTDPHDIQPEGLGSTHPVQSNIIGDPEKLGPYEIHAVLGQGAMGKVFLAFHNKLQRKVALKVLPRGVHQTEHQVERFTREMAAAGRVNHPNIVRASDAGEENGWHYIAMEFVEGVDLQSVARAVGKIEPAAACEIVKQAALGLTHISECGLVHRDIKPSNLMLSNDGEVRILDLGIARLRDDLDAGSLTEMGLPLGTPDFIAPEQVQDTRKVDIRADVYSLGCTLYRLLSGSVPYDGPSYGSHISKLMAHTLEDPTPIDELVPELPTEIVTLVGRMMDRDPDQRFQTPAEVVAAIEDCSEGFDLVELLQRSEIEQVEPQPIVRVEGSSLGTTVPGVPPDTSPTQEVGEAAATELERVVDSSLNRRSNAGRNIALASIFCFLIGATCITRVLLNPQMPDSVSVANLVQTKSPTTKIGNTVESIDRHAEQINETLQAIRSSVDELEKRASDVDTPARTKIERSAKFDTGSIGWTANTAPEHFNFMTDNDTQGNILADPNPIGKGSGLTLFRMPPKGNTQFEIAGVDTDTFSDALVEEDYLEFRFRTADVLGTPVFFRGVRQGRGNRHHWMGLTITDDESTYENTNVVHRNGGTNAGTTIDMDKRYQLKPGTEYIVRVYFWDTENEKTYMVDDFILNFHIAKEDSGS